MKRLRDWVYKLFSLGIKEGCDYYLSRQIRIVNLLAWIMLLGLTLSLLTIFLYQTGFPFTRWFVFTLFSISVLVLNAFRLYLPALVACVLVINFSILNANEHYSSNTAPFVYYFPEIFAIALLHNPKARFRFETFILFGITIITICIGLFFDFPFLKANSITPQEEDSLRLFNILFCALVTALLILMVIRLFNRQHKELLLSLKTEGFIREDLRKTLKEKEVLFAELNHRVKNNLAVISSMISLQSEKATTDDEKKFMREFQNRIQSIGLAHNMLFKNRELSNIELKPYVQGLINGISAGFSSAAEINLHLDDGPINISSAIPLGLIINEAFTNSNKYAFPFAGSSSPRFDLAIMRKNHKMYVTIRDNGPGFPNPEQVDTSSSLGMVIITSLADQLEAQIKFSNDKGAVINFEFPIQN